MYFVLFPQIKTQNFFISIFIQCMFIYVQLNRVCKLDLLPLTTTQAIKSDFIAFYAYALI
jgi:hypothetical protein